MRRLLYTGLFIIFSLSVRGQFYDGSNMTFGKNRVQFDEFEWQYFRFKNYETYFYTGGKEIAIYSSKAAKKHIADLEAFFEFYNHERIRYILYNKYDHYKQSNIGIVDEQTNLGGVNKVIGTKVFLYFEGDHQKLERELRAGTAEVLLSNFLYGGDWRNIVRNSDMYKMPDWYFTGLVSYLSRGWDTEINDIVKDGTVSGRYDKLVRLEGEEAKYAGHSVWTYISETYGESVISNILFVTKINRDVESGFMYVLGINLKDLMNEWNAWLDEKYKKDGLQIQMPDEKIMKKKAKKRRLYYQFKADPSGNYYTYATNKKGKAKIYIYDKNRKKKKKIFKHGIKLDRPVNSLYPRMAWHPTGEILAFTYQKKGKLLLNFYEVDRGKTTRRKVFLMEDILDLSYSRDGRQMTFSGVYEGQSDIYIYNIAGNTQQKITDDRYDDLNPIFVNDSKEIVFSSNRLSNDLEHGNTEVDSSALHTDLFAYKIGKKNTTLRRITETENANESNPIEYRNGEIYYISDEKGRMNIYRTMYDSAISSIDTIIHYRHFYTKDEMSNFKRNIREFTSTGEVGEEAYLYFENKRFHMKGGALEGKPPLEEGEVADGNEKLKEGEKVLPFQQMTVIVDDHQSRPGEINIHNYRFSDRRSTELSYEKEVIVFDKLDKTQEEGLDEFSLPQQRNYNLSFFRDQSILQINNTYLNQQYQPFTGTYQSPDVGVSMILGISDLFEDHKIYGGVRLGQGTHEYFLSYQNLKKRLDKEYFVGISNGGYAAGTLEYKLRTLRGALLLKYPFTEVSSFHMFFEGRRDRSTPLAIDQSSLQADILDDYWASYKMAYVYDNTRDKGINIKFGTRYKIYGEAYKKLDDNQENINVVGADFRHYQRIHREAIFVTRFAASTSFGTGKLVYYLGGVDNWMGNNRFNTQQPINGDDQNYMFQANATNLRGFQQNIRNGNSMVLVNTELRWPIFRYFVRRPIRSPFLKNFQLIGFGDIGTAWTGTDPYSEENDQIKEEIDQGSVQITLKKSNEPIVGAYGFGIRMALMGYFMRIDWAWGVENDIVQPRRVHFSLSLDI